VIRTREQFLNLHVCLGLNFVFVCLFRFSIFHVFSCSLRLLHSCVACFSSFVVLGLVSSVPSQVIGWEQLTRLRCDLLCVEFDVKPLLTRDQTDLFATRTFIHEWNEPYILPLLPSRTASPHLSRYSFPVPLRVGGWVGLGGWLHPEVVCPPDDSYPSH